MEQAREGLIRIMPGDTVAVALSDLPRGCECPAGDGIVTLENDIPFGHKVALADIALGENVIKYGAFIGHALVNIRKGEHVHTHNLKTNLDDLVEYQYSPDAACMESFTVSEKHTFDGYLRADGRAGTRNEVWIIPSVGCVNNTATALARLANERFQGRCDGVFAYTHNMGCSQLGDDMATTQRILAGLIGNPNAGGVLVLSLGCENNHLEVFKPFLAADGGMDEKRVKFQVTQDAGDEIEAGLALLDELTAHAATDKRQPVSADKLVLGFKCGGSDAFSGITANAVCGRVNDRLIRSGGTTILTEVPEMFGAETLLMRRAVDEKTFVGIVDLINNYKRYFTRHGQTIYENPSPGNKKGGISTLEEKSLGCIQKGGLAPVVGVLDYGEQVVKHGLNLLTGSGNDQVSCTNLVAGGATMILFTTGRGNPYGSPVPTVKIASNSRLAANKKNWIDFNAGQILDGVSMEEAAEKLFRLVLDVASGRVRARNEEFGYRDISIFRDGVIL